MTPAQFIYLGLQNQEQIKEKLENAPDQAYEIGVVIGTYLPFILLVVFAYLMYYFIKKKKD